jgi:hypothetical protein
MMNDKKLPGLVQKRNGMKFLAALPTSDKWKLKPLKGGWIVAASPDSEPVLISPKGELFHVKHHDIA